MQIPIETYKLDNGLFVTLSEDHTAPIVAVNLWYHVGSANEREGRTGFAHLFEHMLFQGSANVSANEHFELVQRAGGTLNGSTWLDRTNYFETVPSNQLELALWLEANRMGYLLPAMTQQKLDTQRDVVKNERRWSVDNQPYGTWWERLPALCFPPSHPFHHSLIGSMEDLDAASLEDVEQFFATYYTPDNAVLSIAGDFDRVEARRLVERHFGPISAWSGQAAAAGHDAATGPWRAACARSCRTTSCCRASSSLFGPRCSEATSTTPRACVERSSACRKGSRLHRHLVRERQVAAEAQAFTYRSHEGERPARARRHGPSGGTSRGARARGSTRRSIDSVTTGVTTEEVARAVTLIETDSIVALQAAGDRADQLSLFATYFGDPSLVNTQVARYREVTPERVNAFARARLGPDNRASLLYVPRDTESTSANQELAEVGAR